MYSWEYKSSFYEEPFVSIDSTRCGNLLRFVNDLNSHNIFTVYLTINGEWKLFYAALRDID